MSQSDLSSRLREAIALVNGGRRTEARSRLLALSQDYPNAEQVWMWLAAATDDKSAREQYLRRALEINPRNEKARAAITELTGQAPPPPPAATAPDEIQAAESPAPAAGSRSRQTQTIITAVLILVALVFGLILLNAVGGKIFAPPPTATRTPSATISPTPSITFTPSITPGGPTLTPRVVDGTLPPSWTPSMTSTPAPTRTRPPSLTPLPSNTPSATAPVRPTVTRVPTITPGGPTFTPKGATTVPSTPTGSATATPVVPTATPTETVAPTL